MGNNDRLQSAKEDRKNARQETKRLRRQNVMGGAGADWQEVDGDLLKRAVAAVARNGGALRLGYTRDGGAFAVGVYGDGDPFTEYLPPSESVDEYLKGIIEDYGK